MSRRRIADECSVAKAIARQEPVASSKAIVRRGALSAQGREVGVTPEMTYEVSRDRSLAPQRD
jgi:hypothetical protein